MTVRIPAESRANRKEPNYFWFADNPPTILDQTVGIVPPSMM
jgi:hypothetical protein